MKQIFLFSVSVLLSASIRCQTQNTDNIQRPKLVVGIVIDQMRWDFLYRYYPLFSNDGGFKKLLNKGFSCENTLIPYTPTVTACGHSCIYTGSVPAINGIVGNFWFDKLQNKLVYCCDDDSARTIGSSDNSGNMSPKNLLATTIGDELKTATNFTSKVIGISLKDRGAILPAGRGANAAYWLDAVNGEFVSSSYYMGELPGWVKKFNKRGLTDSLLKQSWNLSLAPEVYEKYCGADEQPYERQPFGEDQKHFPYNLSSFAGKDHGLISVTPFGNNLLKEMAESAIINENLGKNNATDFLAVSFSAPDYIGHTFGPDSWEQMDDYIKLDQVLGEFLSFLDGQVGAGNYLLFLTADHGVANSPGFSKMHHLPGGVYREDLMLNTLNQLLKVTYNSDKLVKAAFEYQIELNHALMDSLKLDEKHVIKTVTDYALTRTEIAHAFATTEISSTTLTPAQKQMFQNGYFPQRSGDIQFVLKPGYVVGDSYGSSHGLWNPYDAHIPLIWYGWGIAGGKTNREVYMTDIAPTVCALLHIQTPSGSVGKVIPEIVK